jgi:putative transposase
MPRLSRLVVPGYPHHITQRGVRSINIFANDQDRLNYLHFMAEESDRFGVTFLGWCLMSNHVHLIAVPESEDSLARAIGEAHRRYTRMKNFAAGVRGYLFQGRFSSCVLDQRHLLAAGRYVERNPVTAKLVGGPQEYLWSSCRYHCRLTEQDPLLCDRTLPGMVDDWSDFLGSTDKETERNLRSKTRTGRPAGDDRFVLSLEVLVGKSLRMKPPGRRRRLE